MLDKERNEEIQKDPDRISRNEKKKTVSEKHNVGIDSRCKSQKISMLA